MMDIDSEAFELIRQQIQADLAKTAELKRQADLAEQTLKFAAEAEFNRKVAERNRLQISLDTNEKASAIANELPRVFLAIYGNEESLKEIERRLDRQDEILLIILTGRGNGNRERANELVTELKTEGVQRLIWIEQQNLQELEEQAAQFGSFDVPLKVVNAIRRTKTKLESLERKLQAGNTHS